MKLDILNRTIPAFAEKLLSRDGDLHVFKYDLITHFREQWTFEMEDFAAMYDRCLQSDVTKRLWKREGYRPKEVMLLLIETEEQYARQAFRDLFNESKNVENRVDRFIYYCDEILRLHKRNAPHSIENNHYQDSAIISLYLSAIYPDRYTLYPGRVLFNRALLAFSAPGTGEKDELFRFFSICRTLHSYLLNHSSVRSLVDNKLRPGNHLLLAHEFLLFVGQAWGELTPR